MMRRPISVSPKEDDSEPTATAATTASSASGPAGELSLTSFAALLSSYRPSKAAAAAASAAEGTATTATDLSALLAPSDRSSDNSFWSGLATEVVATLPSLKLDDYPLPPELIPQLQKRPGQRHGPSHEAEALQALEASREARDRAAKSLSESDIRATRMDLEMNDFPSMMLDNVAGSFEGLVGLYLRASASGEQQRGVGFGPAGTATAQTATARVRTESVATTFKVVPANKKKSQAQGQGPRGQVEDSVSPEEEDGLVDESIFCIVDETDKHSSTSSSHPSDSASDSDGDGYGPSSCSFDSSLSPTTHSTTTVIPLILEVSIIAAIDGPGDGSRGRAVRLSFCAGGTITGTFCRSRLLPDSVEVAIDGSELLRRMTFQARCLAAIGGSRKRAAKAAPATTTSASVFGSGIPSSAGFGGLHGRGPGETKAQGEDEHGLAVRLFKPQPAVTAAAAWAAADDASAKGRKRAKKTNTKNTLADFDGTSIPPRLWNWAPLRGTEKQQVAAEYSLPVTMPLIAWFLDFGPIGWYHCYFFMVMHTVNTFLTDWGPDYNPWWKDKSGLPYVPLLSTDVHCFIDVVVFTGSQMFGMLLCPEHYGGKDNPMVFWTALSLIAFQPVYLAVSYGTKDYKARIRRNRAYGDRAKRWALWRARDACEAKKALDQRRRESEEQEGDECPSASEEGKLKGGKDKGGNGGNSNLEEEEQEEEEEAAIDCAVDVEEAWRWIQGARRRVEEQQLRLAASAAQSMATAASAGAAATVSEEKLRFSSVSTALHLKSD